MSATTRQASPTKRRGENATNGRGVFASLTVTGAEMLFVPRTKLPPYKARCAAACAGGVQASANEKMKKRGRRAREKAAPRRRNA